jgi:hypothetical protein
MKKEDLQAAKEQAKEAFKTWRDGNPNATEHSGRKVWAMYNGHLSADEAEKSFPSGGKWAEAGDDSAPATTLAGGSGPAV